MPGTYQYDVEIKSNVAKLLSDMKQVQDRLDTVEGKEYKIKLNVDEKKLSNVISNLEKMLDSLGKGTGDFKQFENLSKELLSIVSEVQSLSKAFGKVDDSGAKTLLSSIQNIDKSLSELSQNILNVNKNMSNMGGNTSGAVKQVENITNESKKAASALEDVAKAQAKVNGQKTNISSGDFKEQSTEIDLYHNLEKRKVTYDEIIDRIQTIVSLKEKEKSLSKTSDDTKLYQNLYDENDINWAGDTEGTINRISDRLKEIYIKYNGKISLINENDIQEAAYLLDILKGAGESPNLNKSQEKFYQNKKFSNDSLFDNIHVDSQKTGEIDKINTELSETYRWFNQLEGVSLNENIANEIKSLISDMQIGGKTANEYANDLLKIFNIEVDSNSAIEQQNKLQSELKETESQAEKTAMAVKEISSTTSQDQKKDAFPNTDTKLDEAVTSAKDLDNTLNQVNIPTDSFDKVLEKLDRTKSELVDIVKITKQSVSDADGKFHDSYTLKDSRGSTEIYGMNSKTDKGQILRQNIVGYDSNAFAKAAQEEEKLTEAMAKGREQSEKARQVEEKRQELAQNNAINKALEEEYRQRQKLAQEEEKQIQKNKELVLSYTESASKKISDAISKYSYGDSSDATAMMKQMNRGLSNFGDLSSIESNIKNFDSIVDAIITDLKHSHEESLSALNNEIKTEETMQKQKDAFNKSNLNAIDMEIQKREEEAKAFSNSLKAQIESQQQAESQMSKLESTLSKYQAKTGTYDATIARFNDGGWTSDAYLKNVQAVRDAVKQYATLLDNIKTNQNGIASDEDIQNLDKYEKKIKDTIATVTNMSASEKGYNFVSGQKELDKIHKLLNENSKMSSEAKAKIKAYYAEIESGNPSMSLDKIHGEIMKIYNAEVEAGRAGRSFFDTLKNSGFHQIAAQVSGMFGVYDIINLGKNAFNTAKELDYALVDLKKTTAMNSSELEQFYYDSNDVAKQMGVTTKEIIDQASSWSRLGYNSKEAATEMAKLSSQFALISPGMDTTTSQEGLVSIMKAWDIGYQDVKSQIMDDINALGNAMAEDNQDIVEGMERSAAALAAVGTSTKDAFALFSGIQEVLQNSEKSGTSLRSVALRLRSFDESTEEYSSDLANITGELADLTKTAEHAQGVSVFKAGSTTEFKSLVDYFREIADIWDEMSQKQQNDFLLKAFGRTQAQAGAALIQNFKGVEKALNVMDNAAGSSDKEMETAKQSITYKLNELKQTWVGTVQDIAKRKDLALIVSGLTDISKALGFVIGKLGLIPTLIVPITAILGKGKSPQRFCPIW